MSSLKRWNRGEGLETLRGYLKEQKFEKSKNRVLITAGISATRLDGTRLLRKMKVCYERLAHFTDTMRDMFNHHTSQCSSVKNAQALNEIVCRWNKKIDRCKDFEKRAAKVYRVGDESTVFVHLKMRMVEAARAANGLVNTTPTTVTEAFKIIT